MIPRKAGGRPTGWKETETWLKAPGRLRHEIDTRRFECVNGLLSNCRNEVET